DCPPHAQPEGAPPARWSFSLRYRRRDRFECPSFLQMPQRPRARHTHQPKHTTPRWADHRRHNRRPLPAPDRSTGNPESKRQGGSSRRSSCPSFFLRRAGRLDRFVACFTVGFASTTFQFSEIPLLGFVVLARQL